MMGGGSGSSHGNMMVSHGKNVWSESFYRRNIGIFSQEPHLLLTIGESLPDFNFMKLVARQVPEEREFSYRESSNPANFNVDDFQALGDAKYIKIPEDVRKIQYLYKTTGLVNNLIFCIHSPAYNFQYNKHTFMVIDGKDGEVKEYKVTNFVRYKDGGTTIIDVLDDKGVAHKFFSPTKWEKKDVTWDENLVLTEITEKEEIDRIVKLLGIELEPEEPNYDKR